MPVIEKAIETASLMLGSDRSRGRGLGREGNRTLSRPIRHNAIGERQQSRSDAAGRRHEAARELGLSRETLESWIRRSGARPPGRQPLDLQSDDPAVLKAQMRDLEKRLERAEMERDILKKATAFFASQNP